MNYTTCQELFDKIDKSYEKLQLRDDYLNQQVKQGDKRFEIEQIYEEEMMKQQKLLMSNNNLVRQFNQAKYTIPIVRKRIIAQKK